MTSSAKGSRSALVWRTDARTGQAGWHLRLSQPDGSRRFVPLDPSIGQDDVEAAKVAAQRVVDELGRGSQADPRRLH